MTTTPEHRSAVLDELSRGGTLIYDDGEVAVLGPRAPQHALYATGLVVLVVVFATTLLGRILVTGLGTYGAPGVGASLATLLLVVTAVLAGLVLLGWYRAVADTRSGGRRVVYRDADARVHVVPQDVYDQGSPPRR